MRHGGAALLSWAAVGAGQPQARVKSPVGASQGVM